MSFLRRAMLVATLGSIGTSGAIVAQRWYRRWGATDEEHAEALPGDAAVSEPMVYLTHAITIDAAPEDVWPWIAQLGTGRAGWYSYDWIENAMGLGVKSRDRVDPDLQLLHVGDEIPLAPDLALPVKRVERPNLLLLEAHHPKRGDATWLFLLRETDDGATRLVARLRARWPVRGAMRALLGALEPGMFAMQRKMMIEIKRRAEGLAHERMPAVAAAG